MHHENRPAQPLPAEKVDATRQDIYWRQNHMLQAYAYGRPYEDFRPAYQVGYEGFGELGLAGKTFEECEAELRARYEKQNSPLSWDEAKLAARSAWNKFLEAEPASADDQPTVIAVRFDPPEISEAEATG